MVIFCQMKTEYRIVEKPDIDRLCESLKSDDGIEVCLMVRKLNVQEEPYEIRLIINKLARDRQSDGMWIMAGWWGGRRFSGNFFLPPDGQFDPESSLITVTIPAAPSA